MHKPSQYNDYFQLLSAERDAQFERVMMVDDSLSKGGSVCWKICTTTLMVHTVSLCYECLKLPINEATLRIGIKVSQESLIRWQ